MRRLLAAFAFLTRVPIRTAFTAEDVGRGAMFFPVVGAAVGAVQYGVVRAGSPNLSPLLVAVLAVSVSAWLTRGLHLDGLADFVDGLGGGREPEDVLRIMKDSRIGAFGAVALVLVLGAKIAAFEAMASPRSLFAIVLAPALARWTVVVLGYGVSYARSGSTAPSSYIGKLEVLGASVLAAGLVVVLGHVVLVGVVVVVSALVAAVAVRRIGGVTGDVLGANVELAETAALVAATL